MYLQFNLGSYTYLFISYFLQQSLITGWINGMKAIYLHSIVLVYYKHSGFFNFYSPVLAVSKRKIRSKTDRTFGLNSDIHNVIILVVCGFAITFWTNLTTSKSYDFCLISKSFVLWLAKKF